MREAASGREPDIVRRSLRSELLFNLAFLAAAALLLALWTASLLQFFVLSRPLSLALLVILVVLDLLIFVALGNSLVNRLIVNPLAETAAVAEAIAGGDYERRAAPGTSREMALLATALNRLTDQLLQNQERLADNVRSLHETNQLLHDAQSELVQAEKLASIGRFAAGVAHEIGNPLGALLGYSSVLRRRGAPPDILDRMDREARRIDRIVRDLLDYSRPGAGTRAPVDANASIRRVLELLEEQGRLTAVRVRLDLEEALPCIEAVPNRLDQMFVNLLTNAVAAMEGSGVLTVVTRRERYRPDRHTPARRADDPPGVDYSHLRRHRHGTARDANRLQPEREVVRIVIADTGPGIPRDQIDFIFDPFFTTKAPGEGTGLGLSIVAGAVADLGGRIEVTSAEGGGAVFHLFLPVMERSA